MYLILILISSVGAKMSPKIVGGNRADITDWPFITLVLAFTDEAQFTCGGSLLSSQTVLTAAHCLDDVTQDRELMQDFTFTSLMGHNEYEKSNLVRDAVDYRTHQKYNSDGFQYDIGILFLIKPVTFSATVKKALLMKNLNYKRDRMLTVAGWGKWMENENVTHNNSPFLKSLAQTLITNEKCQHILAKDAMSGVICAGGGNIKEFAYSGDSGGPLITVDRPIQVGIVSFRLEKHGYTVYTSVPFYYKWIETAQTRLYNRYCVGKQIRDEHLEHSDENEHSHPDQ